MVERDADGIAVFTIGPLPEGAGLAELLKELHAAVAEMEDAGASGTIRGVLVRGPAAGLTLPPWPDGHPSDDTPDPQEGTALSLSGQRILRRLEQLPIPSVAAIEGAWLGGGLEVALACAYRVAAASPRTLLGLPQVRAGIIPGLGGTVRLPRLIGVQAALDLILSARPIDARRARTLGLVDEALPALDFLAHARAFLLERLTRGRARRGGRRRISTRLLGETAPGRRLVLARSARRLLPAVQFAAPAPERALHLVMAGVGLPLDEAFDAEAAMFGELAAGDRARALSHASRVVRAAAGAGVGGDGSPPVEQAAVVGAGRVGSDLAYLFASGQIPVRLKDVRRGALAEGLQRARRGLAEEVRSGRINEEAADRRDALLTAGTGWGGFGTMDLVATAVGGEAASVAETLRQVERHTRDSCMIAVTASHLSIAQLQTEVARPERLLGLRLCPPVDRFPLLELVPAARTSDATVAACRALARRIGRTALLVGDRPGGVANRLLALFFAEATRLLDEGAGVAQIDGAAQRFGFVIGPFRRMDAMGVASAARLLDRLAAVLGPDFAAAPTLARAVEQGEDFYRYRAGRPASLNPSLPAGFRAEDPALDDLILGRLVLLLVNGAARILEEGVVPGAEAIDTASLLGLGFPRTEGGLLYHADRIGAPRLVEILNDHAARFGPRFTPAPLVERLAREGQTFSGHPRRGML